jgi:toxin ParE1/3/4
VISYTLTERAEDDLLALFLDGIEMFGLTQARRYKDELAHCFQLIASRPRWAGSPHQSGKACAGTSIKATSFSMKKHRPP